VLEGHACSRRERHHAYLRVQGRAGETRKQLDEATDPYAFLVRPLGMEKAVR
jgi:hypothetical protein